MATLKNSPQVSVDIWVYPEIHQINVMYGEPALVSMDLVPAIESAHGSARFDITLANRLAERIEGPLPVSFELQAVEIEIADESEREQVLKYLQGAIRIASRVVLEIDSPAELLNMRQQSANAHFCTWPARFGGQLLRNYSHQNEGEQRNVVEFEFHAGCYPNGPIRAFEATKDFFFGWNDSCVGQTVEITLRNCERELWKDKQVIGADAGLLTNQ